MKPKEIANLDGDAVLIVHGLAGHRLLMAPLALRLRAAGLRTRNWGYRSLSQGIAQHADRFREALDSLTSDASVQRVHIVAHSMGAIITRQALLHGLPDKLGRIVMLGPPNYGSPVATRIEPVVGWLSRTPGQLSDRPDSWVNCLPDNLAEQVEVGLIIAGGDWVVEPQSTLLPGIRESIVIPGMHTGILFKAITARAIVRFVRLGSFCSSPECDLPQAVSGEHLCKLSGISDD